MLRIILLANQIAGFFNVQYLMIEVWDEIDFLYADKHKNFQRVHLCFTYLHCRHLCRCNLLNCS